MQGFLGLLLVAPVLAGCLAEPAAVQGTDLRTGGFSGTDVFPGTYDTSGAFARVLEPGPFGILPFEFVELASPVGGAVVPIGLFRPAVPEGTRAPVIAYVAIDGLRGGGLDEHPGVQAFVPHGYAVALLGTRGWPDAGGCVEWNGPGERADLGAALRWLRVQAWSSGALGVIGASRGGAVAWEAAATGDPGVRTIVPVSGWNDLFRFTVHNGTSGGYVRSLDHAATLGPSGAGCWESPEGRDLIVRGTAAAAHLAATGERDPLGYWEERDSRPGVEARYRGSVFVVHALNDVGVAPRNAYPWVTALEERGTVVKQLLGRWSHDLPDASFHRPLGIDLGPGSIRLDWMEILLHWFDYWLKDHGAADLGPVAQVADSQGRWRSEDAWPPADAVPSTLYLAAGGSLAAEPGAERAQQAVGPHASQWLGLADETGGPDAPCPACARFEGAVLQDELRFAGLPRLHLTVTPTGPGGHLTANLYAVHADGSHDSLGAAQMDLRFADGGERATAVMPFRPLLARMQLGPLDTVVPAGSHLVLLLSQGRYDAEPEGCWPGDLDFCPLLAGKRPSVPPAPMLLHVGGDASALILDTFARGPERFFDPPGVG